MKKLIAILASGVMLFSATANAMTFEQDFSAIKDFATSGFKTKDIGNCNLRTMISISGGKLNFSSPTGRWMKPDGAVGNYGIATSNSVNYGYMEKTWDTTAYDGITGQIDFSFDILNDDGKNLWDTPLNQKNDSNATTFMITLLDSEDKTIAAFNLAKMTKLVTLNGESVADATHNKPDNMTADAWTEFTGKKPARYNNYQFTENFVDNINQEVNFGIQYMFNGAEEAGEVSLTRNGLPVFDANYAEPLKVPVPAGTGFPAKLTIQAKGYTMSPKALQFDNIKLGVTDDMAEEGTDPYIEVFWDKFDDSSKRLWELDGWYANNYLWSNDSSIGWYCKNGNNRRIPILKQFAEPVNSGKLAVEFGIEAFKFNGSGEGEETTYYSSAAAPAFAAVKLTDPTSMSSNTGKAIEHTKVASLYELNVSGTSIQMGDLGLNGVETSTTASKNSDAQNWLMVDTWKVVIDLDNNVSNFYYKNEGTDNWLLLNTEPVALVTADTGIDAIMFDNRAYQDIAEFSKIKAYTIGDDGFETPVLFEGDEPYTVNGASKEVTIKTTSNIENVIEGEEPYPHIIAAVYDENGKFVECKTTNLGMIVSPGLHSATYTLPANATEKWTLKAFVWDGLDKMIPLSDVAEVLPAATDIPAE